MYYRIVFYTQCNILNNVRVFLRFLSWVSFQSMTPSQYSRKNSADDVMHKMWSAIRTNNGIKVLMSLLLTKTPINHADELRMAACKALNGLCRSRGVRQIASKLHLMSSGQLLALMREPILPGL